MNPNLLLISYQFPPAGGIAVQRALSFARYLPRVGVNVHVLSASNPGVPTIDPSLLSRIPAEVQVHRAFTPEPSFQRRQQLWRLLGKAPGKAPVNPRPDAPNSDGSRGKSFLKQSLDTVLRRLFCPDPEVVWVPFALRRATRIVEKYGIHTVMVTAPPFSSFLIGVSLKRRFPRLRLISDFRDEWLDFYIHCFDYYKDPYLRKRSTAIEREVVEHSDLVLAVTEATRQTIRNRYRDQPEEKFACIPNGYDAEVFSGFHGRKHGGSHVVVTHVGTAYSASTPRFYLDALDRLPQDVRSQFETRFIGRITEQERQCLQNRASKIVELGFMRQAEAVKAMEDTDYLLVTMTDPISIPGKLLEYLAANKPILAIASPGSEVDRLMRETKAGWCADFQKPDDMERVLLAALHNARENVPFTPDRDAIERYSRENIAAQLAERLKMMM
jgi:glycosyltransferase involved in cell wall biosynthesis